MLGFAIGFAVVATGVWTALVASDSDTDLSNAIAYICLVLNFGGQFLTVLIQLIFGSGLWMIFGPPDPTVASGGWLEWTWFVGTVFVGALAQGLVYAALGGACLRWWRARRARRDSTV